MLKSMEAEMNSDFLLGNSSHEKNDLLIFDRTSDLVTPLLTQLTYEGLIDETYTIESSTASFPFSLGESVASGDSIVLDNFDKVFNELRDQNITSVGSTLYQKSIWIKQSYEKRKEVQHLKELKEFLKTLPEMQEYHRLISIHTNIATELGYLIQSVDFGERIQMEHNIIQQSNNKEVFEYIENLIFRKPDISSVLRLMCLHSVINGGLRTKDYERLKESLMLTYGIPHVISTFFELEKCGLLRVEGKQTMNYSAVRKQFQTWVTNLDERKPNDISYTYSGYAPPIVRFVEKYAKNANIMAGENDLLNLLPGPREEMINPSHTVEKAKRNIFVCIIGGITSSEISALRFVESQCQSPVEITVVATELLTGKRLVNSLVPFA
ncbi:vacuolar protein sorting-like protein [Angomonas deanei]|uniref:Sec1 family, putative n=1 Tax=Angomonas deanei TaxID=59799 RepID=A0A7G2CEJ2_9TRYP|nr:vacuolar protein sorting-like protein [Angomonas deanei]CAD2217417.1 Sec1 family, putative [Angomonas deanei]|eukprot:EPY35301.1 vacuolar protein sorting-like protein [Angomonas deanei]